MNMEHATTDRPTILVVDDVPDNLSLMGFILKDEYRVKVANNGEKALRIIRSDAPPDLILLDVMMPGMTGYEVCRQIRMSPATRDIPVIFVTARSETEDEKKGLDLGAVDYVSKPISPPIILARIRNHLELKKLHDHLAELVTQRTRELEEALSRLTALDAGSQDYLRTISHELRTPAHGVLGIAELALDEIADEALQAEYRGLFEHSRERLLTAIDAALQLGNLQGGGTVSTAVVNLSKILADCTVSLQELFAAKNLVFVPLHTQTGQVTGNEELLRQSVTALLNAAQRLANPGTRIVCQSVEQNGLITLRITIDGRLLPDSLQRTFFNTFSLDRANSYVEDMGLALPLAAELVRAMGGSLQLKGTETGSVISLTLPRAA